MAARTNLVLTDRASTPVDHTFVPNGDDANGNALFVNSTSVPLGNPRFSIGLKRTSDKYKPSIKLAVPVVQSQTINGVSSPVIVRTAYANVDFSFDGMSSEQERADLVGMLVSALSANQTQINDLVTRLNKIY